MKTKNIIAVLLVTFILASCAPAEKFIPTETAIPTSTPTNTPTPTFTATSTPVSFIEGLNNVPKPDSIFIEQMVSENYLKVMGVSREQVNIVYAEHTDNNGQPFVVMVDKATGIPMAFYDGIWRKATLKFFGEQVGIVMGTDTAEVISPTEIKIMSEFDRGTTAVGNSWKDNEPSEEKYTFSDRARIQGVVNDLKKAEITDIVVGAIFPGDFPNWLLKGNFSQDELREIMKKRIRFVIDNNPNATSLIVVNEPYVYDNPRQDLDVFYKAWGNYEYITEAFQIAREYSEAQNRKLNLIYNDQDNHYAIGSTSGISRKIVAMLHEKGLIDYVGMETHIGEWREGAFDELMVTQMPAEIEFYKKLGVPVLITELTYQPDSNYSLSDAKITLTPDEFEKRLSHVFGEVFRIAIESGNVQGITFWGLSDKWFKLDNVNWYGIFDEHGQPKQSYYIVLKILYEGIK